ncbi:hypothetical protein ACFWMQ_01295 [Streptomyces sp. NPDC058372]|uniref:hypothetical protein n=1 Tax=Streptomyces sp. NPDC058372 TaxID=3346464 RepID=UPI00364D72F7
MTIRSRKIRSGILAATSAVTTASVLIAGSPAMADGKPAESKAAATSARTVERATGTTDLAAVDNAPGAAAHARIEGPFGHVTVSAPSRSNGEVTTTAADGSTFKIGLPETADVTGTKAGAGTVVYPDAAKATDFAVQPTSDGGTRTLITLKDSSAPRTSSFALDLPEGAALTPDGEGGYILVKQSGAGTAVLGGIEAPWAKDANGKSVATEYRLDGNNLIQTVAPESDAAYPIVADPKVSFGTGVYIKFSKAEVKGLKSKVAYASSASALCGLLINPVAAVGCAGISQAILINVQNVWAYAAANKRCVEIKMTYSGFYSHAKHYKC